MEDPECQVQRQFMADLPDTIKDAKKMYDFSVDFACVSLRDITIMSDKQDFGRIFKKPEFEGDFLENMVLWALNDDYRKIH